MEIGDLERFKARAMEIVRKSRDPASCIRLMRIKAASILGSGDLDHGQIAATESSKSVEAASTTIVPTGDQPTATTFVALSLQGEELSSAEGATVEEDSGETDEAFGSTSDLQGIVQLHAPAVLGIQLIKPASCSDLMNGFGENLEFVNEIVYLQVATVPPSQEKFENSKKESDGSYARILRNTMILRICHGYGVLVEEEPDPGGLLLMQKRSAKHVVHELNVFGAPVQVVSDNAIGQAGNTGKVGAMVSQFEPSAPPSPNPVRDPKISRTGGEVEVNDNKNNGALAGSSVEHRQAQ